MGEAGGSAGGGFRLGATLREYLRAGGRRNIEGLLARILVPYAVLIAIYEIWIGAKAMLDPFAISSIFLSAMLVVIFVTISSTPQKTSRGPTVVDYCLSILSFGSGAYLILNMDRLVMRISMLDPLTTTDIIFGLVILILTLEATRRSVGLGLTVVVLVFVLYIFLGHLIPGSLWHRPVSLYHFLDQIVYSSNGVFGIPVRVAATYAFLFVMFGTFLQKAGGGDFFFDVAASIAGKSPGGHAKVAVVSSGLYGMLSGSPTSDVVTTGSVTIPMMKRAGYDPVFAGAVETAASTGGSIMPPVMGSAVFLMAEVTGISYASIALAALFPALLFYEAIFLQVHFRARNVGLAAIDPEKIPTLLRALRGGWEYAIPLGVLIWFLAQGYTASYVAVMGVGSVFAVSLIRSKNRLLVRGVYDALASTTLRMIPVTAACAAAGLVVGGITMTGLAGKFTRLIFTVGGSNLFISLIMAAIICIILGMGMPVPSAYILAAVLLAPAILKLGVAPLSGHLFIIYFSVMSAITPPVAVAAYAASSLADANPWSIAVQALKLSIVAFLVPIMFVYDPALLLEEGLAAGIWALITAATGVVALAAGIEGRLRKPLGVWLRIVAIAGGITMMYPGFMTDVIGFALVGALVATQLGSGDGDTDPSSKSLFGARVRSWSMGSRDLLLGSRDRSAED